MNKFYLARSQQHLPNHQRYRQLTIYPYISLGMILDELEKVTINQALDNSMGNKNDTAKQLSISVKILYHRFTKYEVQTGSDELSHFKKPLIKRLYSG